MTSSPTPAVLPEARAQLVRQLDEHASGIYKFGPQSDLWSLLIAARDALSTPPASDAAVPAGMKPWDGNGKPDDYDGGPALQRNGKMAKRVHDWGHYGSSVADGDSDIIGYTAAAPKVASDTGAGTLAAVDDGLGNDWFGDQVLAALATDATGYGEQFAEIAKSPTDATDGATGGGEEWTFTPDEREKEAILSLCADQELSPTAVMRQALRLYQHDHCRRKDGETVTWSGDAQRARDFAGPIATTPGADLLEQEEARRHRAALQDIADAEPIPNDAVAFVWCRTVAQDSLSARNQTDDGGEK